MITVTAYTAQQVEEVPPEALEPRVQGAQAALWVDLEAPSGEELGILSRVFNFHPLTIEDVQHQRQRPKIEEYDGYSFIVVDTVELPENRRRPDFRQLAVYFGPTYVVTVHAGLEPAVEEVRRRLAQAPGRFRERADYLLYTVLDSVVDDYMPVLDRVSAQIDRLEDHILRRGGTRVMDHLFDLKRTLLHLRRVVGPQRDVLGHLTRRDLAAIRPEVMVYLRDIHDHMLRVMDMVDTYRDLLVGAMDIHLTVVSNRLNEVMKVLTVVTLIFAPITWIAGVYGMNFKYMPELEWHYGYFAVWGVMVAVTAVMLVIFRRLRWI